MKKDWKYLMYLGTIFLLYLAVQLTSPKTFNWTVTYRYDDKNPYGTYALTEFMPSVLKDAHISNN